MQAFEGKCVRRTIIDARLRGFKSSMAAAEQRFRPHIYGRLAQVVLTSYRTALRFQAPYIGYSTDISSH